MTYSEKETQAQWARLIEALKARGVDVHDHQLERQERVWRWQRRNADTSVSIIATYVGTPSQVWEKFLDMRNAVQMVKAL